MTVGRKKNKFNNCRGKKLTETSKRRWKTNNLGVGGPKPPTLGNHSKHTQTVQLPESWIKITTLLTRLTTRTTTLPSKRQSPETMYLPVPGYLGAGALSQGCKFKAWL